MPTSSHFYPSRSLSCPVEPLVELRSISLGEDQVHPVPNPGFQSTAIDTHPPESALNGAIPHPTPYGSLDSQDLRPEITTPKSVQPSRVPIATPTKSCRTPAVSPFRSTKKPPVPLFLTKYSSVTCFDHNPGPEPEWDHDRREKSMEEMFAAFMTQMHQQGQQSSGLKEAVEVYKTRSESQKALGSMLF